MSLTDEKSASSPDDTSSMVTPPAPGLVPTRCPYCEHVSPQGSKFCNACGAALHLLPCPHCGAVNDVTLFSACARCNGDLGPALDKLDTAADPAPAFSSDATPDTTPDKAALEAAAAAPAWADLQADPQPPALQTANWALRLSIGLVLLIVTGAVGTYTYVKRMNTEARLVKAALGSVVPERTSANATMPAPMLAASSAPVAETEPDQPRTPQPPPSDRSSSVANTTSSSDPAALTAATRSTRPPPVARAARPVALPDGKSTPPRISAVSERASQQPKAGRAAADIEPKPAVIGPCTDAVAALGLCTLDNNTPRRP